MFKTGIIRRVDELGRVVLPKGVRQECGIQENDPLEIAWQTYINNDGVAKKYIILHPYIAEE